MLNRTLVRFAVPVAIAAGAAIALSGCSSSGTPGATDTNGSGAPVQNGAAQVAMTLTSDNDGTCALDNTMAPAGPITFTVTNQSATSITEVEILSGNRIVGEKENLAPGLPAGSFTVTLDGGTYQVYCPGAGTEKQDFTVTGAAAAQPTGSAASLLDAGTLTYTTYVDSVTDSMLQAVTTLDADIQAGDLAKAQNEYVLARPFYERIESDVDGFVLPGFQPGDNAGSLDYLIDMRESALDDAVGWHGFHAIERDLFQGQAITDQTKQYSTELLKNVTTLDSLVKTLTYKPEDLANGAADLLDEVQSNKITGEEELYSHIDLVDFAGNVEGAEQAFANLQPGLQQIDPTLTQQVSDEFAKVDALLDTYRDSSQPSGYKLWTDALKASDAATLSQAVQQLQEPLSQIAEKVATAD